MYIDLRDRDGAVVDTVHLDDKVAEAIFDTTLGKLPETYTLVLIKDGKVLRQEKGAKYVQ